MEKPLSDYIQIRLKFPFHSSTSYLGYKGLLPILNFLETSSFPKPSYVEFMGKSRTRMRKKNIHSYLDIGLLDIIEPIGTTGSVIKLHTNAKAFFLVTIFQANQMEEVIINIDATIVDKMPINNIEKVFVDLLLLCPETYFAQCCFVNSYAEFNRKYMDNSFIIRPNYFPFLVWLQYISAKAFLVHGSLSDFEVNPFLKTKRLHDGIIIEVGNSPNDIFTDEGEALLAKATFSLPSIKYPTRV